MNYGIKIDLLKLEGAFVRDLQGKTATKRCIIIPVDDNDIYLGQKGCYLNMTAIEMAEPKFNDTHCIKPDIPKAKRETMTDEQRRAVPILGGMRPLQQRPQTAADAPVGDVDVREGEELPF